MSPSYSPNTSLAEEPFAVSVRGAPQTSTRLPAVSADTVWGRAAVPRANTTGNGAYTEKYKDYTVLQQHVLFWDRDMDGVIYPWHTYAGFRDLGFNMLFSALAMVIIHMGFSYPTRLQYSYLPDPLWGVYVGGIHKAKHGSDSETYDSEGRFRPQQFEDMFAKYARENCGYLTLGELFDLMKGNRNAVDPFGWFAAVFEFGTTYLLVQKDGKVGKEDLKGIYDGSLFWRIRAERNKSSTDGAHGRTQARGYGLGIYGFGGGGKSTTDGM